MPFLPVRLVYFIQKEKKVNSNVYEIRNLWHKIGNLLENLLKNKELSTKQYGVTVDKITVVHIEKCQVP